MKSKKHSLLKPHCLFLVTLIIITCMPGCSPSTPPDEVSKIFFKNITYFEHQRAYDFLSKRLKEELSKKNINRETFFGYLKAPIGNHSWIGMQFEIKEKIPEGNTAALVSFSLKDLQLQQSINGECKLVIENGLWQVDHLQFEGRQPLL